MFIKNVEDIKTETYKCGKIVGNYLMKVGIPLLSYDDNDMVFANTDELQKAIDTMPYYIKMLVKVGVING